ncbi:MAG: endonuclease/exonuclease/phosphatase family protein [Flavobacteriales bacterium]|nr:endonuclease/exonuclease/phosphatase family protein [Flavobacteriales bacterium]
MTSAQSTPGNSVKPKRASRWHLPLWWANGAAVLVLLVTYLAPQVSPATFWPLMLLAFAFPFQLLLHLGFLLYWLLFRRKRMLLSGIALLIGWGHIADHVQFSGRSQPPKGITTEAIKVLSWNVRLFDLYNWKNHPHTRDRIFELLHREDAGILCLQEFFSSSNNRFFLTRDALVQEFPYHEHLGWALSARKEQFGVATFSKHPIVGRGRVEFARRSGNICIWSDIAIGRDTVRVYNAHLASYHFGKEDYRFIEGLDAERDADSIKLGGGRILQRLRIGSVRRAQEVEAIEQHMAASPFPVLFCGDINDVPMSYAYARLRGDRRDAFVESGRGLGGTYIGRLPSFRIDHMLHDKAIASWDFRTLPEELSDHHPISAVIAVR